MAAKRNKPKRKNKTKGSKKTIWQKIENHLHFFNASIWILFLTAVGSLVFTVTTAWQTLKLNPNEAEASPEGYNDTEKIFVKPGSAQVEAANIYPEPFAFSESISNEQNSLRGTVAPNANLPKGFVLNNDQIANTSINRTKTVKTAPAKTGGIRCPHKDLDPEKSSTKGKHMDEDCCADPDEWANPKCAYDSAGYKILIVKPTSKK